MRKLVTNLLSTLLLFTVLLGYNKITGQAMVMETNGDSAYFAMILDEAGLLSSEELELLLSDMMPLTEYGSVVFATTNYNMSTSREYAETYYYSLIGQSSGILLLIDMDNRTIWMSTGGQIHKTITDDYAYSITDNVYRYASQEDYYRCASEAFAQALTLLEGKRIFQPMKYICNLLLGLILAFLLNFGLATFLSRSGHAKDKALLDHMNHHFLYSDPVANLTHETKEPILGGGGGHYHGGGGSRSGGGFRGGGGGGFRGGGGGHRF